MKFITQLRGTSAIWAAPIATALALFYFLEARFPADHYGWAPTIVSDALGPIPSFAYAVVAGLAAWECGRLKAAKIWNIALGRSRYRVAANALVLPVLISWWMLVLPVLLALSAAGALPTAASLRPLLMAMALCVAHAAVGCAAGLYAPRAIAFPLVSVGVFMAIAFSAGSTSYWPRHVSGQLRQTPILGELISWDITLAPVLFGGSVAVAAVLLWFPTRLVALRVLLACAVASAGTAGARGMVDDWDHSGPIVTGLAPMACKGSEPKVCVPRATSAHLDTALGDTDYVLDELRSAGVESQPRTVTDTLTGDLTHADPAPGTWYVDLTKGVEAGDLRYRLAIAAVRFRCSRPDLEIRHTLRLWATTAVGENGRYEARMRGFPTAVAARSEVARVSAMSRDEQADWYRQRSTDACHRVT